MAIQRSQLEVGIRVGDYELISLLGRGGMGEVWLASDLRADRLVALKFIKASLLDEPSFKARFLNEAKTLGRLEHDRIVTLYNVVEDGEYLALVLRFIEGTTPRKGTSLADRIDEHGALPLDFVLASARDILPALGFAHQRSVIHRDIKPQNVLLDGSGRSFLTDFGIAVGDFAERGTQTGSAIGTPEYMSPEQILDSSKITAQTQGHRTDIYSYGVVLYEMLTGRTPFGAHSGASGMYRIQQAHCSDAPASLREVNPIVPAAVENVVLRCLAKSPDDRPQTCAALLQELEEALAAPAAPAIVRAATVIEKRGPADPVVRPQVVKVLAKRNRFKTLWPAAGAALIAGGIFYAATSRTNTPPVQPIAQPHPVVQQPPVTVPVPAVVHTPSPTKNPGTVKTEPVPLKAVPVTPPPVAVPAQPTVSAEDALAAKQLTTEAADLDGKGDECPAEAKMQEAIEKDPRLKIQYAKQMAAYTRRCKNGT